MMQRINWLVFVSGFAAVLAQTLIVREALALFSGNELVSGILLCFWLVWGGIGSIVFTSIRWRKDPQRLYTTLLFFLCLCQILSLIFIRVAPWIFNMPLGEVIDLGTTAILSALTLAPVCVIIGMLFPAAARILEPERVYLLEGLGAFTGGLLSSFVFLLILPPFGIMLVSIILVLLSALLIVERRKLLWLPLLLIALFPAIKPVEMCFRKLQMRSQDLVDVQESRYGVIAVTESNGQYNFYTNGLYDFSHPDPYSSEEAVHYALLLHPEPKNVLLVGGGIGGCIAEILKHPSVQNINYVELDPMLFAIGQQLLGQRLGRNEKLTIVFGDARYYMKHADAEYDVIIVNLPDPVNAQVNRFYTKEFFNEARRRLRPGGLLSLRITSPPDIISPLYGQLLSTVRMTLMSSLDSTVVLPAGKTTFIATDDGVSIVGLADTLRARIIARDLDLTYVNYYYFRYDLTTEKIEYLNDRINASKGYVNRDLKPVCYYFTSILWGGIVSERMRDMFLQLFSMPPILFFLPLIFVFFFFRRRAIIYLSVLAVGASEISAEVILIVLFQVFYGYVYGWLGAIIACYMLGLAIGALVYIRSRFLRKTPINNLARVEIALSIYFLTMIAVAFLQPLFVNVLIAFLVFFGGLLGGIHFQLSVAVLKRQRAGFVYGVDLLGSSAGVLITAMILIPILGIIQTLFLLGAMNLLIGIGLATVRSR